MKLPDPTRWLRHKEHGAIYGWNPILAANPKCEEVTHEEAFPEQHVNAAVVEKVTAARKGKKVPLSEPPPAEEEVNSLADELSADASRGLPK